MGQSPKLSAIHKPSTSHFTSYLSFRFSTEPRYIREFLDDPATRSIIGVDPSVPTNFSSCNHDVGSNFHAAQDTLHPTKDYVGALLERGVKILIYAGTYDWICNWVGNERWTLGLEWTGKDAFNEAKLTEWIVEGKVAGKTRSADGLTFATVSHAGHMVCQLVCLFNFVPLIKFVPGTLR